MKTSDKDRCSSVNFTRGGGFFAHSTLAFTMPELLVILGVLALMVALILPALSKANAKAMRIRCVSHLKNIGLANRIFATDNSDLFPWERSRAFGTNQANFPDLSNLPASAQVVRIFQTLSNELSTPSIIACPADTRKSAATWQLLTTNNISYFLGRSAQGNYPQSFMAGDRNIVVDGQPASGFVRLASETKVEWDETIHHSQGSAVMGDGSVQQLSSVRLREQLRNTGLMTNDLIFP